MARGHIAPLPIDKTTTIYPGQLGQKFEDNFGRTFRLVKAGASNLARGKLTVAPTVDAQHVNMSFQTAPAAGDRSVKVTLGSNAATLNQYQDGWLVVSDDTGQGRAYQVEGHPAADASATLEVTLKEKIDTAGAVSEANVDLIANPHNGVVISATDQNDQPTGVPIVAIAASAYGWVQTGGPCSVLQDATTPPAGDQITISAATPGAVGVADADTEPIVGVQMATAGVSGSYQMANLTLD